MEDADSKGRGLTIGRDLDSTPLGVVRESGKEARHPPVFLHSSFRTGSTWLWQKIRSAPTTIAYYEIFNEVLETLTVEGASQASFASWDSRHPVASPYFLEFLPLLAPQGGIGGFNCAMSYHGSIPLEGPDGELHREERAYVDKLIATAATSKRVPVLSCTRSLGRARALRRAFGGQTIVLHRNLFHQWASYASLAEAGNTSFMETIDRLVTGSAHDPFLRSVADWFDLAGSAPSAEVLFQVFVILHLYLLGIAFDAADLVIDLADLAADLSVRRRVEREVSAMIHYEIDLSDVRQSYEPASLVVSNPRAVRDTIEQFAKLIPAVSMSSECIAFLARVKEAALSEWERFDMLNRRLLSVSNRRVEEVSLRLQAQTAEADTLRAEKDRLTVALSESSRILEVERTLNADAMRQRENAAAVLRDQVAAAEAGRSDLASTLAGLVADRDGHASRAVQVEAELHELRANHDALSLERAAATADRDRHAARATQAESELQELRARHAPSPSQHIWRRLIRSG